MLNSVTLIGRLTAKPELKQTQSGAKVLAFTLALNGKRKDENGKREAYFIPCVAWNNAAEYISKYATKGTIVAISGYITQSLYTKKDGTQQNSIKIVAENVYVPQLVSQSASETSVINSSSIPSAETGFNTSISDVKPESDIPEDAFFDDEELPY